MKQFPFLKYFTEKCSVLPKITTPSKKHPISTFFAMPEKAPTPKLLYTRYHCFKQTDRSASSEAFELEESTAFLTVPPADWFANGVPLCAFMSPLRGFPPWIDYMIISNKTRYSSTAVSQRTHETILNYTPVCKYLKCSHVFPNAFNHPSHIRARSVG